MKTANKTNKTANTVIARVTIFGRSIESTHIVEIDPNNLDAILEEAKKTVSEMCCGTRRVVIEQHNKGILLDKEVTVDYNYYASKGKVYCNEYLYSDRHAYEVVDVQRNGNLLGIRRLKAHMTKPYSNDWTFESDPDARVYYVKKYRDGYYGMNAKCHDFKLENEPNEYYDYEF